MCDSCIRPLKSDSLHIFHNPTKSDKISEILLLSENPTGYTHCVVYTVRLLLIAIPAFISNEPIVNPDVSCQRQQARENDCNVT